MEAARRSSIPSLDTHLISDRPFKRASSSDKENPSVFDAPSAIAATCVSASWPPRASVKPTPQAQLTRVDLASKVSLTLSSTDAVCLGVMEALTAMRKPPSDSFLKIVTHRTLAHADGSIPLTCLPPPLMLAPEVTSIPCSILEIPDRSTLLNEASTLLETARKGPYLTKVGRAFQKHSQRRTSHLYGPTKGDFSAFNLKGLHLLESILDDPAKGSFIKNSMSRERKRYGQHILEIIRSDGIGVRFSYENPTKVTFIGLLEPKES